MCVFCLCLCLSFSVLNLSQKQWRMLNFLMTVTFFSGKDYLFSAGQFLTPWLCDQKNCPAAKNVFSTTEKRDIPTKNVVFVMVFNA